MAIFYIGDGQNYTLLSVLIKYNVAHLDMLNIRNPHSSGYRGLCVYKLASRRSATVQNFEFLTKQEFRLLPGRLMNAILVIENSLFKKYQPLVRYLLRLLFFY